MRAPFFLFLLAAAYAFPTLASACPLGAGEDKLSLTRVMRNFGKTILPADRAAKKGAMGGDVSDAELDSAVQGLTIAMSCAQIVSTDRSGDLYPRKASGLTGDARERYLELFFSRMKDFLEGLSEYRALYAELRARPLSERNFEGAKAQMRAVEDLANRAHESLE
jgi:hypothetical protein